MTPIPKISTFRIENIQPQIMIRLLLFTHVLVLSSRAEDPLWNGNKLTPEQPFPGRVLAVESSWGGYRLLIESAGKGGKTYCIAQVWPGGHPHLDYKVIEKDDFPKPSVAIVYLNPPVEINRFSWSMGPWKIGKIFGDEDSLSKVAAAESDNTPAAPSPTPAPPPGTTR